MWNAGSTEHCRSSIIDTFAVENVNSEVTDFLNFYTLLFTIMNHPPHKSLKSAYSFYNVHTQPLFWTSWVIPSFSPKWKGLMCSMQWLLWRTKLPWRISSSAWGQQPTVLSTIGSASAWGQKKLGWCYSNQLPVRFWIKPLRIQTRNLLIQFLQMWESLQKGAELNQHYTLHWTWRLYCNGIGCVRSFLAMSLVSLLSN